MLNHFDGGGRGLCRLKRRFGPRAQPLANPKPVRGFGSGRNVIPALLISFFQVLASPGGSLMSEKCYNFLDRPLRLAKIARV
jgi:hypothetical protein